MYNVKFERRLMSEVVSRRMVGSAFNSLYLIDLSLSLWLITLNIEGGDDEEEEEDLYHKANQVFVFVVDASFGGMKTPKPSRRFRRVKCINVVEVRLVR